LVFSMIMHPNSAQFWLTPEQKTFYQINGYLHVSGILSEQEIVQEEPVYTQFINGLIPGVKNDLSDIDGEVGKPMDSYAAVSVMLPSRYNPSWQGNIFELRALHIAQQLEGDDMRMDYDRLIAKKPNRPDAVFHWHQDKNYCSKHGALLATLDDPRAVTVSLALDDTTAENGCISYIPGSHKDQLVRQHYPVVKTGDTDKDRLFIVTKTEINEKIEPVVSVPVRRGDVTIHGDFVVHGSGGNHTNGWRRNYILGFRPKEVIQLQKTKGLDRSLNIPNPISPWMMEVKA